MPTAEPHTVNVNRAIKRRTECFLSARQHLSEAVSEVASSAAASEGLAVRSCVCAGSALTSELADINKTPRHQSSGCFAS